jgi:rhodanese-related sulfurtransferase
MMQLKKMTTMIFVLALVAGVGAAQASSHGGGDWQFHTIVDVDFVKSHVTVPMAEDVMIIDARPKRAKYDKGHIPMSVSIPHMAFDKHIGKLPENKDALLIYYCGGVKCKLSHKSAHKAEKLGYTNVKVFADGYPGWLAVAGHYGDVSTAWMKKQIDKGTDMVVVDSRPKRKKFDKGHIPGALSIPTTQFDKFKDQLPADKDKLVVFYCGGFKCKLSHKGAAKAIALGHTNVKVFSAGYPAWKKVAKSASMAVKGGAEEGSIDIANFKEILTQRPESVMLVDVRDADEFSTGSFKTAVNIPVEELEAKVKTLPADKPIIFVCGTGARSGESFYMLQDLRPELKKVFYVEGEIEFKKDGTYEITVPKS